MSIHLVEKLHERLREELDRHGLKLAAAARLIGEASPQRLKDVVSGRQKCPAELLGKLAVTEIDLIYVLTGERAVLPKRPELPADEQILLDGYRSLSAPKKKLLLASLLTGEVAKPSDQRGVVVTGRGNRTAGRDYHEKE
ncbi:helix-turn-helix domain-containing protein [Pseudomonas aeruginosa]|uniref:helix-turn-helix domain-containing protein n=1 Tax=Pseudomonas aeruginosa TaxID=287 RepID=UPI0015C5654D|nr:helix-turn-helix transcriptional regulator [Pseudomonas aeruginosa]NPW61176.1 hypothetical protein [Pseudomonas aeruginosa]HBO1668404.1 hypothetical protein [Pseudomonas aeruginosa]HBO1674476.1 hypothetical protein [Pseudomonas aeruginosa]HBO2046250.1 hypothetical protein [Pseudomonas aeruginosa]HBO2057196.1 hypothetical protein [Pseudomonas aeruginosa]